MLAGDREGRPYAGGRGLAGDRKGRPYAGRLSGSGKSAPLYCSNPLLQQLFASILYLAEDPVHGAAIGR